MSVSPRPAVKPKPPSSSALSADASSNAVQAKVRFLPPLSPHKKWFVALLLIFSAWVIFLIVLYIKTPNPVRHG